ncbi:hypothetical protein GCM10020000_87620 [Streptomyces olivoverticillatus]
MAGADLLQVGGEEDGAGRQVLHGVGFELGMQLAQALVADADDVGGLDEPGKFRDGGLGFAAVELLLGDDGGGDDGVGGEMPQVIAARWADSRPRVKARTTLSASTKSRTERLPFSAGPTAAEARSSRASSRRVQVSGSVPGRSNSTYTLKAVVTCGVSFVVGVARRAAGTTLPAAPRRQRLVLAFFFRLGMNPALFR